MADNDEIACAGIPIKHIVTIDPDCVTTVGIGKEEAKPCPKH